MFQTLQFFRDSLGIHELEVIDINECVKNYQNSNSSKVRGKCIASIYCKLFPMILKIQQSFPMLTSEQKTEACIHIIQTSLEKFNITRTDIKFTSYFYGNFRRNLLTLSNMETNCHKRKIWSNMVDITNEATRRYLLEGFMGTTINTIAEHTLFFNDMNNSSLNLTTEEQILCKQLLKGYKTCKELAPFIFPNEVLTDKNYSIINKMRSNLKKKIKNNNYNVI